jgi:hypothetical protein
MDEIGLYGNSALGIENKAREPVYVTDADWHRGMCRAIKMAVMCRAGGVEVLDPFMIGLFNQVPRNPNWALFGWDASTDRELNPRGPHPKTTAFLMTCYWLNRARPVGSRVIDRDAAFLYEWQASSGTNFVVGWCAEGQSRKLHAPASVRVTDIYGSKMAASSLGEEPLLFWAGAPSPSSPLLDAVATAIQTD